MSIISLLQELSKEVVEYENYFFEDVSKFPEYEKEVVEATHMFEARFLGESLSTAAEMIRNSGLGKRDYNIQRKDQRNLISTVGDISFTHILFRDRLE